MKKLVAKDLTAKYVEDAKDSPEHLVLQFFALCVLCVLCG